MISYLWNAVWKNQQMNSVELKLSLYHHILSLGTIGDREQLNTRMQISRYPLSSNRIERLSPQWALQCIVQGPRTPIQRSTRIIFFNLNTKKWEVCSVQSRSSRRDENFWHIFMYSKSNHPGREQRLSWCSSIWIKFKRDLWMSSKFYKEVAMPS